MLPRKLPILARSLRWLVCPAALLILYASWQYRQEGAYWEAGCQLLMLLLLPVVFNQLNRLPQRAAFTPKHLLITRSEGTDEVPLRSIQSIVSVFLWINQRGVFRLRYLNAQHEPQTVVAMGGAALSALEGFRR
ncbi:hypothetical protein [Hymenobacter edaphi]|uniref:Uncharacterized protein n=1 Tax=Hymenobacter edaphi TaxID=2211146 RepID=A0A328BR28_9BACT|nr:hypothetical protein [Hymenobacter edaphi]RAK69710.1 hypothetical protein DLM85_02320 [Hymenobacter edaphi]